MSFWSPIGDSWLLNKFHFDSRRADVRCHVTSGQTQFLPLVCSHWKIALTLINLIGWGAGSMKFMQVIALFYE